MWITTNCGKILKRWDYQITLPVSWETYLKVKKQWLEPDMEQWTGSKSGKEYVKAVSCHPVYLNYMQRTPCKMLCWMNHKLESRWREKYQQPQICRWCQSNGRKLEWSKKPLDEGERRKWKSWLKTQHSKNEDHGIWSHHFMAIKWGKNRKTLADFIFLDSKIIAKNGCSHEIKRCLLLGKKAMTNLDTVLKSRGITLLKKVCQSYVFSSSHVCTWEVDHKEGWEPKNSGFWTVELEKTLSRVSLGQPGDQISQSFRKSTLSIHWKDWCWS